MKNSLLCYIVPLLAASAVFTHAQSVPCPQVSSNPLVMANLCNGAPPVGAVPVASRSGATPTLVLTAQQVSRMTIDNPPMIRRGDVLVFEANRGDFVLQTYLSNGKMIVTQPLGREDAEDVSITWKKGSARLDYPEVLDARIVRFSVVALHDTGTPLLFRGIKIYREGRMMLELEKSRPAPGQTIPEPPMSYPQDPRVTVASVTMPSLFPHESPTGYLATHIPSLRIQPMMQSSTGTVSDPNHYKYTGKEFDGESGLYYYGARHYNPAVGRFMQPDPLYLEMHRLADPQQLNLYAYARNNPTTFNDPTGLDYQLNCKGQQGNCATAVTQLNGRENAQFKVGMDKNKLTVLGKVDASKLSKSERALFDSIKDPNHHATLNVVNHDGNVTMGVHNGAGVNTVDVADTAKLNGPTNAGGLNAGDAVAHEAYQAYQSLFNDADSDDIASTLFPGVTYKGSEFQLNPSHTAVTGSTIQGDVSDGRGSEFINTRYRTPIPAIDFATKGSLRATTGAQRDVEGVTFVPKPPE